MVKLRLKSIVKTSVGVAIIYIVAVYLSLFLCDRMNELESNKDIQRQNSNIVLHLN